jgi:hypothetical protein
LQRVVKPGGRLLLSVSGEHPFQQLENTWRANGADPQPLRAQLQMKGLLHITDDQWTGGPFPDFYHTTFHTPAYVFARWSRYFKIRAYIPQGSLAFQDYVLVERVEPGALNHVPADPSITTGNRFRRLSRLRRVVKRILGYHSTYEQSVAADREKRNR